MNRTYRVWIRDDWGMDFMMEVPASDRKQIEEAFDCVVCGGSIILL